MTTLIRVAVAAHFDRVLDYLPCVDDAGELVLPAAGVRVKVPFGKRELVGVVVGQRPQSECDVAADKLKTIAEVLDDVPVLSECLLQLGQWLHQYYHHPLGEVLATLMPRLLRQGKALKAPVLAPVEGALLQDEPLSLNAEQQVAFEAVRDAQGFVPLVLEGITGSGKTEVYLQAIAAQCQQQRQVLVLIPEISLTPQTLRRFEQRLNVRMVALHSQLTDAQRKNAWLQAQRGEADLIIGTRSAVFVPLPRLGLIVVDEAHDSSFKQQSGLRYSGRDVAVMRARLHDVPIVLGSATPTLATLHNCARGRYQHLRLTQRAGGAALPAARLVDMRNQKLQAGLSQALVQAMQQHLAAGNQVLLFLNRRGYAPVLLCHHCGWSAQCKRCDSKMTLHQGKNLLSCHHCLAAGPIPTHCPDCQHEDPLVRVGVGTERLQEGLAELLPDVPLIRIDRDTARGKSALQDLLEEAAKPVPQVLLGTQMLAKGHHFPRVTLVGVIDADHALYSPDFQAVEQLAQTLIQVAGRAGRAEQPGEVLIQTHCPQHPLLVRLLKGGYQAYAAQALKERQQAMLPPFAYLAVLRAEAKHEKVVEAFLSVAKAILQQRAAGQGVQVFGPAPSSLARKAGFHRRQLLLHSAKRPVLQQVLNQIMPLWTALPQARRVRWSLDVDPLEVG